MIKNSIIKTRNKINIVWIVNDLYINNFITVYNECKKNIKFDLTVIATSHIGTDFTDHITSNDVFNFLKKQGIDCINSWNQKNKKYIDISYLEPDYIFTTTPYDIYLPEEYRSYNLMKIAKLCNIHYGADIQKNIGMYADTLKNPYYLNSWNVFTTYSVEYSNKISYRVTPIGCLKLDEYLYYGKNYNINNKWHKHNNTNKKPLKIIWKPRWTIVENDSNLIKYIDKFYNYIVNNKKIDFVFLAHPLLESNIKHVGHYKFFYKWLSKLKKLSNFRVENDCNFLDCVLSADILIADYSSTIAEFATTGKPIIYTKTKVVLNKLGKKIMKTAYQTNNFNEIEKTINNILKGMDSLKQERGRNKNSYFTIPPKKLSVAQYLLNILREDFNNPNSHKQYEKKIFLLNKKIN